MGQSECKGCSPADPTADTVKVNPTLLGPSPTGKEAIKEVQEESHYDEEEAKRQTEQQCEEARKLEEEARQKAELERLQIEAEEKARQEQERLESERIERECQEREAAEEAAREEEAALEQHRQEVKDAEERKKAVDAEQKKAAEAKAAVAKAKAETEEAQKKVDTYLRSKNFKSLSIPKRAFCGAPVFPLHHAIEENDMDTVKAMLRCRADPMQKGPSNKTALEYAEFYSNRGGNHQQVLDLLKAAT